jgi:hypothetical protein
MTIRFPAQPGAFKQLGYTDVLGNIWSSQDLDLTENVGRIRLAPRGMIVTKSDDDDVTDMTTPVAFRMYRHSNTDRIWAIAGKMMYNAGDTSDVFITDATSNSPAVGDGSDMELFNGALYVIGTSEIRKFDGTWTEIGSNIGTSTTSCCVFGGRLYYSNSTSKISSISLADVNSNPSGTPNTVDFTLQLADNGAGGSTVNTITCIRASSTRIWIATIDKTGIQHSAGRQGKVMEWDGASNQVQKIYYLDSIGALSMIIKDDIPYIVDANGKLQKFNGSGFTTVAELPVPTSVYLRNPTNSVTQQFIHNRGMIIRNDRILMLINNRVDDAENTILENLPSGVWEYDETIGLYHKYSISQWQYDVTTTQTDYFQNRIADIGALFNAKSTSDSSDLNGDILMGVQYFLNGDDATDGGTTSDRLYGIFINDTQNLIGKVGYFVTTKIDSQNVTEVWQRCYAIYKNLLNESDRIVIKYRVKEVDPIEVRVSWTSETVLTSTEDLSTIQIGDEVEITQGTGGGQIEHITAISEESGTYTVTLENAVTGATGDSRARFQKWKKIKTITNHATNFDFAEIGGAGAPWIQLKCVMYFTGVGELNYLQLIHKPDTLNQ